MTPENRELKRAEVETRVKDLLRGIFDEPHCTDPELKKNFEIVFVVKDKK